MERFDGSRQALAIGLAMLAGYVDAIGFLAADGYFVSFMSGNTTRLAVDLAQDWHRALTPVMLIAGFVFGVAGGSVLATATGQWRKPAVTGLVTVLLLLAEILRASGQIALFVAALVFAMGALNSTFQRNGEIAVGLTYMTGALVRLGQAIGGFVTGQPRKNWLPHTLLWLGLAIGALTGALAFLHLKGWETVVAAAWAAAASVAAFMLARHRPA